MKLRRLACLSVAWVIWVASAGADVRFESLTIDEGYPGMWPVSLAQDRQGFLWIADIDVGLIRYDGYEFRSYRLDRSHPGSISSNETSFVHVDPTGTLWIATNAGLDRYDARSDQFTAITTRSTDPAGLSHDSIGFALTDSKGRLWIGTQQGLNRLDPGAKRFHQYHVTRGYRGPRQEPDYFWTGFEDSKGRLWFGSKVNGGLHLYDPQSDTLKQFIYDDSPQSPAAIGVRSIIEDREGFIWVAGSALTRLNPDTMNFERLYLRSDTEYVNPLGLPDSPGTFWCMTEDSAGNLWLGTTTTGVIRISPDRKTWSAYVHDPNDRHSIAADRVHSILTDRTGQVWVGGLGGLSRYNPFADAVDYLPRPSEWRGTDVIERLFPLKDGRIVLTVPGRYLARKSTDVQLVENQAASKLGPLMPTNSGLHLMTASGFPSPQSPIWRFSIPCVRT